MPSAPTHLQRTSGCALIALMACACAGPGLPSPSKPRESASPRVSAAPAPAPPPPTAARLPPEPLPDGCASAVPADLAPVLRLEAIARTCTRGMQALAPSPHVATLARGAAFTLPFRIVDTSRCLRAAAAGSAGIEELALEIVASDDRVLGADQLPGALALANPDGPVCVPGAGEYRAIARATKGSGEVALQVWQAE